MKLYYFNESDTKEIDALKHSLDGICFDQLTEILDNMVESLGLGK